MLPAAGSELSGVTEHRARDGDTQRRAPHWGPQGHRVQIRASCLCSAPHSCHEVEPLGRRVAGRLRQPLAVRLRSERTPSSHRISNLGSGTSGAPRFSPAEPARLLQGCSPVLGAASSIPLSAPGARSALPAGTTTGVLGCCPVASGGQNHPRVRSPGLMTWSGSRELGMSSPVTYSCPRNCGAGTSCADGA